MYRARDVIASTLGLIVLSPIFLITAVAVKLDSQGPAIYRQERVGQNGTVFRIRKFRSMVTGAGLSVSTTTDPRITRVGKVIRLTKIDELPQLFDVLLGDMSLVGPRPEVPEFVEHWPEEARVTILSVRPGITDPASVVFRDEAAILALSDNPRRTYIEQILPQKVNQYLHYVANRTFQGDLRVLAITALAIVRQG
ncbi:sugar transferase [Tessaracoccus sp. ZS01]|nr:sugar transferase [Tessaracoccus sp. ZS01]